MWRKLTAGYTLNMGHRTLCKTYDVRLVTAFRESKTCCALTVTAEICEPLSSSTRTHCTRSQASIIWMIAVPSTTVELVQAAPTNELEPPFDVVGWDTRLIVGVVLSTDDVRFCSRCSSVWWRLLLHEKQLLVDGHVFTMWLELKHAKHNLRANYTASRRLSTVIPVSFGHWYILWSGLSQHKQFLDLILIEVDVVAANTDLVVFGMLPWTSKFSNGLSLRPTLLDFVTFSKILHVDVAQNLIIRHNSE